jgi:putative hemolysin
MSATLLAGIVLSFIGAFFFPGVEFAFLASSKPQLLAKGKQGLRTSSLMGWFVTRPSWLITTTHTGYAVSVFFFIFFTSRVLIPYFTTHLPEEMQAETVLYLVIIAIASFVLLFVVEIIARSFFVINPTQMTTALAYPFIISFALLFPLVFVIVTMARLLSSTKKQKQIEETPVIASVDMNTYLKNLQVKKYEDRELELDKKIFRNALEFKNVRIRDCMIPRTEIVSVRLNDGMEKLKQAFIESGHSKILVYSKSADDIIGFCHSSSLFTKPKRIEDILSPVITVPETTLANELINQFLSEHKSLALVMNEFGSTSGIVSIEDIIEEIFGEIEDEHDEDDLVEQKIDSSTWLLSARLEIKYLNETHGWDLPQGDYDTLGGLILSVVDDFPKAGETIKAGPFFFTVQATKESRLEVVKMQILPEPVED